MLRVLSMVRVKTLTGAAGWVGGEGGLVWEQTGGAAPTQGGICGQPRSGAWGRRG